MWLKNNDNNNNKLAHQVRVFARLPGRFSMFKVAGALTCERAKDIHSEKESFKRESFVAVLRNASVFLWLPSMRLVPGCRVSVSPSHTSCVSFVTEAHYISPMGEYSFHCALKDHNLEMLRVKNNLLSCMLNETCLLLTSESTKNKLRLTKKGGKTSVQL